MNQFLYVMNILKGLSIIALSALMLSSCKSAKTNVEKKETTEAQPERKKDDVSGFRTLSLDKATITLLNASGSQTSLNGSVRIARDSMIICSITPFEGINMEFARIYINKEGISILNRIEKQYFTISFEEAQNLLGMAMNYNAFESIFTNRVFIYNNPYIPLTSDFNISPLGDQTLFTYSDNKVAQEFYFDAMKKLSGGMISSGNQYSMRWNYSDFDVYNNVNFPKKFSLKIAGPDFHKQVTIQYKSVELDRDRNFEFKIPASYKKVALDELLGQI